MFSDLIQQLQQLQRGFSALPASLEDADALSDEALAFRHAARSSQDQLGEPESVDAARRAVAGLLQQYGPLNSLLLNSSDFSSSELAQLMAACIALQGCAQLSDRLPLQQNDAFRLGSALALVFGAGLASLRWQATSAAADHTALLDMLLNCSHQLAAAAKALQCAAHPKRQPQAAAAFVRTAGRPDAVLPWLLAASQALLAVPP